MTLEINVVSGVSGVRSVDALHHPRDGRSDQKANPDNEHQAPEAPHGSIIDQRGDQLERAPPHGEAVVLAAELLIDCEEDRTFRAVLVGILREADPRRR
jgi:hypothetical protein